MNERIRELAEQQGLTGSNYLISSQELEKFAELVVSKCIKAVEDTPLGYGDYRDQILLSMRDSCVESIKYEFGLQEI